MPVNAAGDITLRSTINDEMPPLILSQMREAEKVDIFCICYSWRYNSDTQNFEISNPLSTSSAEPSLNVDQT